jgi:hypothetical protein
VLSQAVRLKLQELGQLQAEHSQLSFRHNTLASTCAVVQLLGSLRNAGQPSCAEEELMGQLQALMPSPELLQSSSYDAPNLQQQQQGEAQDMSGSRSSSCESLSRSCSNPDDRQQQQQQQQMQLDSSSGDAAFGGWVDVQEDQTLGTLQDPLRMLRHALCSSGSSSGLALGDVEHMSLRQLQDDYQGTVNQLALHLSFLDNPFKRSQQGDANPFVNIKRCDQTLPQRHWCRSPHYCWLRVFWRMYVLYMPVQ